MLGLHKRGYQWLGIALAILLAVSCWVGYEQDENLNQGYNTAYAPRATSQAAFEPVLPNYPVRLPADFFSRPEFAQEWWMLYALLEDEQGKSLSVQWNFLRLAQDDRNSVGWQTPQLYFSSIVINGQKIALRDQKMARGGIGQAGIGKQPFRMWIDNWSWRSLGIGPFPGHLQLVTDEFSLNLQLLAQGAYRLAGEQGYQVRQDLLALASYQFEQPNIVLQGELALSGTQPTRRVTGRAWLSKEWGSDLVANAQIGSDRLVIPLSDEQWLTVNRVRHQGVADYVYGMFHSRHAPSVVLTDQDIQLEALSVSVLSNGKRLPLRWRLVIPKLQINVTIEPLDKEAWHSFLIPYWEGRIKILGSHTQTGFIQLSGY
ncbi:lipocalin-like domain-containing protein [Vibrio misgurnus]|uniref:lipocalin-like domain-containing protein n=1 Tax=Vibrio misgurnus TaxID=2993714 RepID=UPI002415D30D|nr:lipocalin-like domain-containing protein [Vibrio sp. gvc]